MRTSPAWRFRVGLIGEPVVAAAGVGLGLTGGAGAWVVGIGGLAPVGPVPAQARARLTPVAAWR